MRGRETRRWEVKGDKEMGDKEKASAPGTRNPERGT